MTVTEIAEATGDRPLAVALRLKKWVGLKRTPFCSWPDTIVVEPILAEAYIAATLAIRIPLSEAKSGIKRQHKGKTTVNKNNESG